LGVSPARGLREPGSRPRASDNAQLRKDSLEASLIVLWSDDWWFDGPPYAARLSGAELVRRQIDHKS
jgi:hypothetical protein